MSNNHKHGISIGLSRVKNYFFIKMDIVGSLTHEDYEIIAPLLENALQGVDAPKISLLIDATKFDGWGLQAAWDDLKLGLKHNKDFEKIAFVGNKSWQEYSIKISNWFSLGKMEYFENMEDALAWLSSQESIPEEQENKTMTEKEILSREEAIENQLEFLFKTNMKITDWDVPEADDAKAAAMIVDILQKKLDSIKDDVKNGKYDNY
jgi:hypothetical protein